MKDAEVSERRRADTQANDIEAALAHARDQRFGVAVAREAAVAADGDGEAFAAGHGFAPGDILRVGLAQALGELGREVAPGDAADVVLAKDGRVDLQAFITRGSFSALRSVMAQIDGGLKAGGVGYAFSGDIKADAVIHGGADDRQAQSYIDGLLEIKKLHRDQP